MSTKTYVLLDALNSDAPIYQRVVGDQRVKITKPPFYPLYLRVTYQDKNGVSKTIRYKENASDADGNAIIDQRTQIDKLKIDANEPFTQNERRDRVFKNGILVTNKNVLQAYLESYPAYDKFDGFCDDIREKAYKLLDKGSEEKIKNSDIRLRVKAANKVLSLNLEGAQSMLIRLNGSFFETPNPSNFTGTEEEKIASALEACQNLLMEFVDDSEEGGLNAVLKEDDEVNIDDKTTVLIGKLINAGKLSFDAVEGTISKKDKNGEWIKVRDMSAEYSLDERKRLFSDFLNTKDGKPLKEDLEKDLNEDEGDVSETKKRGRKPNS
jgi:hypothetical protein